MTTKHNGSLTPIANGHDTLVSDQSTLFSQLDPRDIEQFYQLYQHWLQQQQIATLQQRIASVRTEIATNESYVQQFQPSTIALAALSQLQACGVEDIDLLDRMLERGDAWLDHTMQLLALCERMDVIQGDYTAWCENALEGAYEWIASMNEMSQQSLQDETSFNTMQPEEAKAIEEQLLQKLMSDGEEPLKATPQQPRITRPLKITQPLALADLAPLSGALEVSTPETAPTDKVAVETTIPVVSATNSNAVIIPDESDDTLAARRLPQDTPAISADAISPLAEDVADQAPATAPVYNELAPSETLLIATEEEDDDDDTLVLRAIQLPTSSSQTNKQPSLPVEERTQQAEETLTEAPSSTQEHEETPATNDENTIPPATLSTVETSVADEEQEEDSGSQPAPEIEADEDNSLPLNEQEVTDAADLETTPVATEYEQEEITPHYYPALQQDDQVSDQRLPEAATEAIAAPFVSARAEEAPAPTLHQTSTNPQSTANESASSSIPTNLTIAPAATTVQPALKRKKRRWYSFFGRLLARLWRKKT